MSQMVSNASIARSAWSASPEKRESVDELADRYEEDRGEGDPERRSHRRDALAHRLEQGKQRDGDDDVESRGEDQSGDGRSEQPFGGEDVVRGSRRISRRDERIKDGELGHAGKDGHQDERDPRDQAGLAR